MAEHSLENVASPKKDSLIKISETYNFTAKVTVGSYVDCKDTAQNWCLAEVVEMHPFGVVRLHYEGWSDKYDCDVKLNSGRIAPLRWHSRGYTGLKKQAIRVLPFDTEKISVLIHHINLLVDSNFQEIEAEDFNQFVRGKLFVWVDFFMTNWACQKNYSQIEIVINFCNLVIRLICEWLSYCPKYCLLFQEMKAHPKLALVSTPHAVATCFPELADMLKLCFGLTNRSEKSLAISLDSFEKKLPQNIYISNVISFRNYKGFDLLLNLISNNKCSFRILLDFIEPTLYSLKLYSDKLSKDLLEKFINSIKARVEYLSEEDLKDFSRESVEKLYCIFKEIKSPTEPEEKILEIIFKVGMQFMQSPLIQKKMFGIELIKGMIPNNDLPKLSFLNLSNLSWKNSTLFIQTLKEYRFIEFLFGENSHSELLRQTNTLLQFCLQNQVFQSEHLEVFWKCCTEKHEDIIRVSLHLLSSLLISFPFSLLQRLFSYIKVHTAFSEIYIMFLEQYTLTALTIMQTQEYKKWAKEQPSVSTLVNLDIFWDVIQGSPKGTCHLKEQAMESLIRILAQYPEIANIYVNKALEDIKKGHMVIRGIQLLFDIDFAAIRKAKNGRRIPLYNLKKLNSVNNIIHNTITDCEAYYLIVKVELEQFPEKTKNLENIDFGTGLPFKKQFKFYIDFIEYYCERGEISPSISDLEKLWKCYIEGAFCEQQATFFFSALGKEKQPISVNQKFSIFDDQTACLFFYNIFCPKISKSISQFTCQSFNCFKIYMLWINEKFPLMTSHVEPEMSKSSFIESYRGLQALWNIALYSNSHEIEEQAKIFLVNRINMLCQSNKVKRKEITESAMEITLNQIKERSQVDQMKRGLNIINLLIEKIECLHYDEIAAHYFVPPCIEFTICSDLSKKQDTVSLNQELTISHLKAFLSNLYKIHRSRIVIRSYSSKMELDESFDTYCLKGITEKKFLVEFKKNDILAIETPRYILTNSIIFHKVIKLFETVDEIAEEIWGLISFLPINEEVSRKIQSLEFETTTDSKNNILLWTGYFGISSNYSSAELTYYLFAINDYLSSKAVTELERQKYIKKFESKNGLFFISDIFIRKNSKDCHRTQNNLKCIEYCMKIMVYFMGKSPKSLISCNVEEDTLWTGVHEILLWIYEKTSNKSNIQHEAELLEVSLDYEKKLLTSQSLQKKLREESYLENIQKFLLKHDSQRIRITVGAFLKELVLNTVHNPIIKTDIMMSLMTTFLDNSISEVTRSQQYFETLISILELCPEYLEIFSTESIQKIISEIFNRDIHETSILLCDYSLGGLLKILHLVISNNIHTKLKIDINNLTLPIIDILFNINSPHPKCKHEETRRSALLLLEQILIPSLQLFQTDKIIQKNISIFLQHLTQFHLTGNWRTSKKSDWLINSGEKQKNTKFAGLKNLGATCYLNSSLQQLFMIPQFQKGILEAQHKELGKEDSLLFQLQKLFSSLKFSQTSLCNPRAFTKLVKINGQILNVNEQKDVDEFIIHLLEQVEDTLKNTESKNLIKHTFKLTLATEIICKDCPHRSETKEEAISLILNVKKKKHLNESLRAFVQADRLEGENAYYCERCDKKVAAYKRTNIKTLPNVLILVLNRFEFNLENLARHKVNDFCEFPIELNMEEYTQEGQAMLDRKKDIKASKLSLDQLSEEQKRLLQNKIPQYYYQYRLKGIIIHSGHLDGGHYYSFIQDREEGNWHEFNDSLVQDFDPKEIPEEAFGGVEMSPYAFSGKKETVREKSRNAYVLFYEREVQLDSQKLSNYKEEENEIEECEAKIKFDQMKITLHKFTVNLSKELSQVVHQENIKFYLTHYLFNPHYHLFLTKLFLAYKGIEGKHYIQTQTNLDVQDQNLEMLKHEIKYFLTIGLRAQDKSNVPKILRHIQDACRKNVKFCLYVAELFSDKEIIREMLSENPLDIVRRWIVELLKTVFQQLYIEEQYKIKEFIQVLDCCTDVKAFCKFFNIEKSDSSNRIALQNDFQSIPYLLLIINQIIQELCSASETQNGCLYEVLTHFAELGEETLSYLNQAQIPGVALEHLYFGKSHNLLFVQSIFIQIQINKPNQIGASSIEFKNNVSKYKDLKLEEQSVFILYFLYIVLQKTKECSSALKKYLNQFCTEKVLDSILTKCFHRKASLNYFAKIVALLSSNSEVFTKSIIEIILIKLQTQEGEKLRLYLRIAHFVLKNKNMQVKNIEQFINYFASYFKPHSNIYRIAECYIDFVIKECKNNALFLNTLQLMPKGLSLLKIMESWLCVNSCPLPTFRGTIFRTKPTLRMSESFSASIKSQYSILTESRREALKKIRLGKIESEFDSEEDCSSLDNSVNPVFEVSLSPSQWVPCQVLEYTEKTILIKYFHKAEQIQEWVEIESDIIAPGNSLSRNLRRKFAAELDSYLHF